MLEFQAGAMIRVICCHSLMHPPPENSTGNNEDVLPWAQHARSAWVNKGPERATPSGCPSDAPWEQLTGSCSYRMTSNSSQCHGVKAKPRGKRRRSHQKQFLYCRKIDKGQMVTYIFCLQKMAAMGAGSAALFPPVLCLFITFSLKFSIECD